nr:hypothetical protein [Acidobacteriota bacterium]
MLIGTSSHQSAVPGHILGYPSHVVLTVSVALVLVFQVTHAHDVVSLVGAYGLTEGTGAATMDSSGNSNTGALLNGAAWTAGKYGFGVLLDGVNDHISIPNAPSLQLGRTGTIEAWVRINSGGRWNGVLGKAGLSDDEAHSYAMEIDTARRPLCLIGDGTRINLAKSTTAMTPGQFYHLACTWDGAQLRLYINGALSKAVTQTITPAANPSPLVIGQYGGNVNYLGGVIDEVRIFNVAVTQANIQLDMAAAVESSPDVTAPSVSLAAPSDGATVSGAVSVVANAADDRVVAGVRFFVDGVAVGAEDPNTPYAITWDTASVMN